MIYFFVYTFQDVKMFSYFDYLYIIFLLCVALRFRSSLSLYAATKFEFIAEAKTKKEKAGMMWSDNKICNASQPTPKIIPKSSKKSRKFSQNSTTKVLQS